jgi:RecJ-like exonuclease
MKLRIKCPACAGRGKLKILDSQICDYCHGEKKVLLTQYLQTLGKKQELSNVLHFQRRSAQHKPTLLNESIATTTP